MDRQPANQPTVDDWSEMARLSRERFRQELGGRTLPPIEEIIREMREERDKHLLGGLHRC